MSSTPFAVEIGVDKRLRQLVLASGIFLGVAGAVVILMINLAWQWRLAILALWVADCLWTCRRQVLTEGRCDAIRLDASGRVYARQSGGQLLALELLSGSLITSHFAWLRLEFADGSRRDELWLACREPAVAWHRLQLLWQQSRECIGQSRRA
jgi:hypothetical protein